MENMNPDCVGLVMKYFVLNPNKRTKYGEASRAALRTYAAVIVNTNENLSIDIMLWLKTIKDQINAEEKEISND